MWRGYTKTNKICGSIYPVGKAAPHQVVWRRAAPPRTRTGIVTSATDVDRSRMRYSTFQGYHSSTAANLPRKLCLSYGNDLLGVRPLLQSR